MSIEQDKMKKKIVQVSVNDLRILSIWQILFLFKFASFENHKLFLILFVQKLTPQIYSYSYLQGKLPFAEHWYRTLDYNTVGYKTYYYKTVKYSTAIQYSKVQWKSTVKKYSEIQHSAVNFCAICLCSLQRPLPVTDSGGPAAKMYCTVVHCTAQNYTTAL